MTNQPTNNEWIDTKDWIKNSFAYYMEGMPTLRTKEERDNNEQDFRDAIMKFCPKPTEVVAPVDIDEIIEKIGYIKRYSDTRYFDWEEIKKELKKLIIDNLPQSISREAVEKLREKYIKVNNDKDHDFYGALDELLSELDDILLTRKDNDDRAGTNKH